MLSASSICLTISSQFACLCCYYILTFVYVQLAFFPESPPPAWPWRGWTWTTAWLSSTRSSTRWPPKTSWATLSSERLQLLSISSSSINLYSWSTGMLLNWSPTSPAWRVWCWRSWTLDKAQSRKGEFYYIADVSEHLLQAFERGPEINGWCRSCCRGLWKPHRQIRWPKTPRQVLILT